ncbi:MAG: response regulator [Alphaproteobacteria bacterium]|jgi:signal transduction histidine kinase|nr:response regulator [Alphaproteobacteria bacterium]MBT4085536.1 response regulator [Alphaproteobacteria bacterium]MBT4544305.1 response regulator [Alphaproteobacteria bacterium]
MRELDEKYQNAWLLIVDDNPANVALLEKMLKRSGYRNVESTTDSRLAKGMYEERRHDLVLLDIRMPHFDGYQIMEQLKEVSSEDYAPVLVLTAQTDMETRIKALEAGARDFLNKPVDQAEALNRIRNLLEVRLLHKEVSRHNHELEEIVAERTTDLRRAMELAETADKAKSEFLAIMSHELRTPLNAIIGFSDIIEQQLFGEIGDQYRDYSGEINSSGKQLLELINNILDVTRAISGETDLDETELDLAAIISIVRDGLSTEISEQNIDLTITLVENLPALRGDHELIERTFRNLLSNSVKFSDHDGKVEVSLIKTAGGGVNVLFEDYGCGIDDQDLPRIIVPFGQSDSEFNRSKEGAGIGLTLAISFIELHDGKLSIDSQPGEGTIVTASFPGNRCVVQ